MKRVKFFLVDDDKIFVFLTRKTIESTKIETDLTVFGDGEQILEHLKTIADKPEALPDIICLDLSMPVMDGWEFLDEYIKLEPQLKKKIQLYLVTSSISPHDVERANTIGVVSDFIIKPLMKEKVVDLIKNI